MRGKQGTERGLEMETLKKTERLDGQERGGRKEGGGGVSSEGRRKSKA